MKSFKSSIRLLTVLLLAGLFLIPACKTRVYSPETEASHPNLEKVAILKFKDMASVYGKDVNARCPICGKVFMTGDVPGDAADILTENLFAFLRQREDFQLIPSSQAQGIMSSLLAGNDNVSDLNIAVETGRALNAGSVVVGHIYRFRDRVGTRYSVESPASVAFGIHLINVESGRIIWSNHFDETQRSLSENLLKIGTFLKRKASWITAREMAISGLDEVLQTFPEPGNQQ